MLSSTEQLQAGECGDIHPKGKEKEKSFLQSFLAVFAGLSVFLYSFDIWHVPSFFLF